MSRAFLRAAVPIALLALTLVSACTSTANVSDVFTALDANGTRRRNVFFTDTSEIHCLAEVGVGRPGVTIEARIRQIRAYDFNENSFFETDRYLAYVELSPTPQSGPILLDLTLGRTGPDGQAKDEEPYIPGSYRCEFALDGEVQGTAAFNIDFPPCPPAVITPGTPCLRFYTDSTECPKYGDGSSDPLKCTCSAKGWECAAG